MKKKKSLPDVIEAHVDSKVSKWVTDIFIHGRRVCLRNIDIAFTQEGSKVTISPVIPHVSQAIELLQTRPELTDIVWEPSCEMWLASMKFDLVAEGKINSGKRRTKKK